MSDYIIRKPKKETKFTTLDNELLRRKEMTWKATGIHSYLCGMKADWKISIADLTNRKSDGRDSLMSGLKELEKLGHINRYSVRNDKGQVDHWVTEFYEDSKDNPKFRPESGFPDVENPEPGFPDANNKKDKNKIKKKENKDIADASLQEINDFFSSLDSKNKEYYLLSEIGFSSLKDKSPLLSLLKALMTNEKGFNYPKEIEGLNKKSVLKVFLSYISAFHQIPDKRVSYLLYELLKEYRTPIHIVRSIHSFKVKENMPLSKESIKPYIKEQVDRSFFFKGKKGMVENNSDIKEHKNKADFGFNFDFNSGGK